MIYPKKYAKYKKINTYLTFILVGKPLGKLLWMLNASKAV